MFRTRVELFPRNARSRLLWCTYVESGTERPRVPLGAVVFLQVDARARSCTAGSLRRVVPGEPLPPESTDTCSLAEYETEFQRAPGLAVVRHSERPGGSIGVDLVEHTESRPFTVTRSLRGALTAGQEITVLIPEEIAPGAQGSDDYLILFDVTEPQVRARGIWPTSSDLLAAAGRVARP